MMKETREKRKIHLLISIENNKNIRLILGVLVKYLIIKFVFFHSAISNSVQNYAIHL